MEPEHCFDKIIKSYTSMTPTPLRVKTSLQSGQKSYDVTIEFKSSPPVFQHGVTNFSGLYI